MKWEENISFFKEKLKNFSVAYLTKLQIHDSA